MMLLLQSMWSYSIDCPNAANLVSSFGAPATTVSSIRNGDCCLRIGITCINNRIVSIDWSSNTGLSLNGVFNVPAFVALSKLESLEIYNQAVSGPFPTQFPPLLSYLDLDNCFLTGSISVVPPLIEVLWINLNYFTGPLPVFPSSLVQLHAYGNEFTGTLSIVSPTLLRVQDNLFSSILVSEPSSLSTSFCDISRNNVDLRDVWYLRAKCAMNGLSSRQITTKATMISTTAKTTTKIATAIPSTSSTTLKTTQKQSTISKSSTPVLPTSTILKTSTRSTSSPTIVPTAMPTTNPVVSITKISTSTIIMTSNPIMTTLAPAASTIKMLPTTRISDMTTTIELLKSTQLLTSAVPKMISTKSASSLSTLKVSSSQKTLPIESTGDTTMMLSTGEYQSFVESTESIETIESTQFDFLATTATVIKLQRPTKSPIVNKKTFYLSTLNYTSTSEVTDFNQDIYLPEYQTSEYENRGVAGTVVPGLSLKELLETPLFYGSIAFFLIFCVGLIILKIKINSKRKLKKKHESLAFRG